MKIVKTGLSPFKKMFCILCLCVDMCTQVPAEFRGTRPHKVTGSCEVPEAGVGNWAGVLWKSSTHSLTAEPLSQPPLIPILFLVINLCRA